MLSKNLLWREGEAWFIFPANAKFLFLVDTHSYSGGNPVRKLLPESALRLFGPAYPLSQGYPKHTTLSSQSPSGLVVTITHPAHPLRGQQVEIIRLRRGHDPDLIIRLPDGSHSAIAASSTDYATGSDHEIPPSIAMPLLLDLDGLSQIVQLFDQLRAQGRFPTPDQEP